MYTLWLTSGIAKEVIFLRCQDAFETRVFKEFQTEVDMLSQVEHLNLVRLMGFLEEKNERILVTEYVTNGNLRQHLDGTTLS